VRFDQICVLTTFDRADSATAIVTAPGLHLKWPYPIQDVQPYSTCVHTQETTLEQMVTKDGKSVVVHAFVAWRVEDPLALFKTLRSIADVQSQLNNRLRDAQASLGRYSFDELINPDPAKSKLADAEKVIHAKLAQNMKDPQDYGIEILAVGIHRLELPKQVTPKVFDRMRTIRERLAQNARSEGSAKAQEIRSAAERDRDIILAFANRHADNIRAEAIESTAEIYKSFKQDEAFAIFLNELEALKKTLQRNTTFILDTQIAPFDLFGKTDPDLFGKTDPDSKAPAKK
jgi:membrane protease subunit HflC